VQRETLALVPESAVVKAFRQHLDRSTIRKSAPVKNALQRDDRRRIKKKVIDLRDDLERWTAKLNGRSIRQPIERLLRARQAVYMDARHQLESGDEKALHASRIALKKFRYVVEGAAPMVEGWTPQVLSAMQRAQKLLGESHDIQVLMGAFEKWAVKKKQNGTPVLNHLERRRKRLMVEVAKASRALDRVMPKRPLHPIRETTHAIMPVPQLLDAPEMAPAEPLPTVTAPSA
jgi:CHAD domain-containing protein